MTETNETAVDRMVAHIESECESIDLEERFDQLLDECYDFSSVGGPFAHMQPSQVLRGYDPIAYRCGVAESTDDDSIVEVGGEYYDKSEARDSAEEFIDTLRNELQSLEEERESLELLIEDREAEEEDTDDVQTDLDAINSQIERLESDIADCESNQP